MGIRRDSKLISFIAIGITLPILPGIMPIQNYQSFRRMTNLCKSAIPDDIVADLIRIEVSFLIVLNTDLPEADNFMFVVVFFLFSTK